MRLIRPFVIAALTLGGLLATSGNASATFMLTVSGLPGGSQSFSDGGTGTINISDLNVTNGYFISGQANLITGANTAEMLLSTFLFDNLSGTAISNLTITVQATGLTPIGNQLTSSLTNVSGTSGIAYTLTTSLSSGSSGSVEVSNTPSNFPSGPIVGTALVSPVTNYTLTSVYTVASVPGSSDIALNGSFGELSPTPAPATALMVVAGLPFLGLMRVIRRRKTPDATV